MPIYRRTPEDFEVEELLAYEPAGIGDHVYLLVEKRDQTTDQVARQLARQVGVPLSAVGYAGRKDRYAVTRQWLSVLAPGERTFVDLELEGASVLRVSRHRHRLRTGKLRGNRFRLVIGEIEVGGVETLERRLPLLGRWGFANRFGSQRFGRDGDNAERARELLSRGRRPRDRRAARFLISALQAAVFNRLLERRGELVGESAGLDASGRRPFDRLLVGDFARKEDSGGCFEVEDVDSEQRRAHALEISPTGLLFGRKARTAGGAVGELERSVLTEWGLEDAPRLPGVRFDGARRALRARPVDLAWRLSGDELVLRFELPSGSYASVLLEELFAGLGLSQAGRW